MLGADRACAVVAYADRSSISSARRKKSEAGIPKLAKINNRKLFLLLPVLVMALLLFVAEAGAAASYRLLPLAMLLLVVVG